MSPPSSARPTPTVATAMWSFVVCGFLLPAAAHGQAICSAPHIAPSLSASGALQQLEPGGGWVQLSAGATRSQDFYGSGGATHDLPGLETATTASLYLTAAVGLLPGLEFWGQVPVHRLSVDDPAGTRRRTGLGDPRVSLRAGSELLGLGPTPLSLRASVKVPGSDFPVDSRVLPLTEGQFDLELAAEFGTVLPGDALYLVAWAGYRWRTEDRSTAREPGDERFAHLALGGWSGPLRAEFGFDVMDGIGPTQNRVFLPSSARRLVEISPTLAWRVGSGLMEVGARVPVSGRNVPTGSALRIGYLLSWTGRDHRATPSS